MEITKEEIEELGFTFVCKDEKTGNDCTYNIPSKTKKGWYYVIVHHPFLNELIISHHAPVINDSENIQQLYNSDDATYKFTTIEDLEIFFEGLI